MSSNPSPINHSNVDFIESLYSEYKQNPDSILLEWRRFFEGLEFGKTGALGLSEKELDVYHLIQAYRNYGHFEASLDPLSNTAPSSEQLALKKYGLTEKDLNTVFQIGSMIGKPNSTLKEIIAALRQIYCGKLSVQCAEALPEVRNWFIREFEIENPKFKLTLNEKKEVFHSLARTEALEKFIHTRYVGTKRFSVEGGDALMPMLETLVQKSPQYLFDEIVIGMAHRGRVNVLANFMGKGLEYIFADFNGPTELVEPIDDFDGDVKYHLGYVAHKETSAGTCQVTLAYNPSHLEAVNPVVLGVVRAAQRRRKDTKERKKVIPVLIHGDAAFAGQGVVLETFQMAGVKGYTVGGTLHIVVDNQIGFTTNPENHRSSHYSSDVAKVLATPVIHVNGDDAESCVRALEIAIKFRQEWGRDIVINMICYRRYGHNEGDEPAYTQPLMYEIIKGHPTLKDIYSKQLSRENSVDAKYMENFYQEKMDNLQKLYEETKKNPPKAKPYKFEGFWKGLKKGYLADLEKPVSTQVDINILKDIGKKLSEVPSGFTPHPKLTKGLLETRRSMSEGKQLLDWGMAELLAYGSLLTEGTSVRLTGQDCVRGTFTHRHAGLFDFKTGEPYIALDHINGDKVEFCVYDSILSEYAVLGFEYGNATADPTFLTIWEAQFGDFCNGAQIIIDQFLTAGEAKWMQMTGLVLLLPHGYEGQGPEHSSARLERWLQLSAQGNIQVVNPTTPAQIFHALRRQMKRDFRKPLIVMSPKSLLRHPKAVSSLDDLSKGTFQEIIVDPVPDFKKVSTAVFVSGKMYYELLEEKGKLKKDETVLIRVEQLYPFPEKAIVAALKLFPNLKSLVWAQEEPKNMGAFQNIYFKFLDMFKKESLKWTLEYVGRPERSSPATGSVYRHKVEQTEIIQTVMKY